jgi:hypothetical protein
MNETSDIGHWTMLPSHFATKQTTPVQQLDEGHGNHTRMDSTARAADEPDRPVAQRRRRAALASIFSCSKRFSSLRDSRRRTSLGLS